MGSVRRGKCEHDFDITGQFDDALRVGMVGKSHAAQLDIVLGRDADFSVDFQAGMVLAKLGAGLSENGFATFGGPQARLMGGRPEFVGGQITHIDKSAPAIARGILAPAGDGELPPAAVAAARAPKGKNRPGS